MRLIAAALIVTLSACVKPIDLADAGTTAVIIAQGGTELNPVIGIAGDNAAPLVALGLKAGARYMAEGTENEEAVSEAVDFAGSVGACNNLLQLAGVDLGVSLTVGVLCGLISLQH